MGYHSGKFATVNNVGALVSWSIDEDSDTKEYINSQTYGMAGQLPGITHWSGSLEVNGAIPIAGLMPGKMFAFTGYEAPDNDTANGTGTVYSGNIYIERVALSLNWESGDIEKMSYEFQGALGLSFLTGQTAPVDSTVPTYYGCKSLPAPKIQTYAPPANLSLPGPGPSGSLVNWPYITQLNLTISSELQTIVNASTGGATDRRPGPWKMEISVTEQEVLKPLFDKDYLLRLQIPVTPDFSEFWDIKWLHVKNFSGIQANRESGAIISRNISLLHTAYDYTSPSPVLGSIIPPGFTPDWWPTVGGGT